VPPCHNLPGEAELAATTPQVQIDAQARQLRIVCTCARPVLVEAGKVNPSPCGGLGSTTDMHPVFCADVLQCKGDAEQVRVLRAHCAFVESGLQL
jgi:hypothetical protein